MGEGQVLQFLRKEPAREHFSDSAGSIFDPHEVALVVEDCPDWGISFCFWGKRKGQIIQGHDRHFKMDEEEEVDLIVAHF